MKNLTYSSRHIYFMLLSKYKAFSSKERLAEDGSFYYDDERLARELNMPVKTLRRGKKLLVNHGLIKIDPGRYKGWATKYWIVPKMDNMSTFEGKGKVDDLSVKGVNLFFKAGQNVTPNKINKDKNKRDDTVFNGYKEEPQQDLRNLTEEQKQGIRAAVSFCGGKEKAVDFFVRKGYSQDVLEDVLKGL